MGDMVGIIIVIAAAGLVQASLGFGYALVSMPLLTLFLELPHASVLVALSAALPVVLNLVSVRQHSDWRKIGYLLAGTIAGVPLGVEFLAGAPAWLATRVLGTIVILAAAQDWLRGERRARQPWWAAVIAGIFSGAFGGAFGISGPPLVIYAMVAGWPKEEFKANLQTLFLVTLIWRAVLLFYKGMVSTDILIECGIVVVPTALAVAVGIRIFKHMRLTWFRMALRVGLLVIGVYFLVVGQP